MKIKLLILSLFTGSAMLMQAQCPPKISCPANIFAGNDTTTCAAIVNYVTPVGIDTCLVGSKMFSYTGQIDTFYVPNGVTKLTIEARGAEGGTSSYNGGRSGGKGAYIRGDVTVNPGDTVLVLVGQQGQNASVGGGGGGSFTALINNTPLVIAGGGGGASSDQNGVNAPVTTAGTKCSGNVVNGGSNGNGGSVCGIDQNDGGAGGGFYTDGADANSGSGNAGYGGKAFVNGGAGGKPGRTSGGCSPGSDAYGGFGGGGSTSCNTVGGGGGGGYSGGAGGKHYNNCVANATRTGGGGGGSFNAGINQLDSAGVNKGNGLVKISWNGGAVPTTQIAGLPSGSAFPVGNTVNTFVTTNTAGSDTCSFTVTVIDSGQATVLAAFAQDTICTSTPAVTLPAGTPAGGSYSGTGVTGTTFDPAVSGLGSFWVYYTDTVGCIHSDSTMITVVICAGVEESTIDGLVQVSPNPSNGLFRVQMFKRLDFIQAEVYDAVGKQVWSANDVIDLQNINIKSHPDGMYYLKLEFREGMQVYRLVKQ